MSRNFIAVLLLLFLSLSADGAEPVKIGLSLGLTGKYSEMSDMQIKGFKLWEKDINGRGGLLGRPVSIVIYDNKSDPQIAKKLYEYMMTTDKVDLLFAPYSSEQTEAILPLTEAYRYPVIASGASSDGLWQKGYQYFFGLYAPASKYAMGFLELLAHNNFANVAILFADDAFSKSLAEGTKQWAEKFGLKVILFSNFIRGTKDFDDPIKKARASGAQALIVCGYFDEAVNVRMALKKSGWFPRAYYASVGPALPVYYNKLGRDSAYTFSSSLYERASRFPGASLFYDRFFKEYGHVPSYHAAEAYAAGEIYEKVIKKTGSLDREKIRSVLSAMDTMTIIGKYAVDRRTGKQIRHSAFIIQWQKGKNEIVWPEYLRTAKPVFR